MGSNLRPAKLTDHSSLNKHIKVAHIHKMLRLFTVNKEYGLVYFYKKTHHKMNLSLLQYAFFPQLHHFHCSSSDAAVQTLLINLRRMMNDALLPPPHHPQFHPNKIHYHQSQFHPNTGCHQLMHQNLMLLRQNMHLINKIEFDKFSFISINIVNSFTIKICWFHHFRSL